MVQKKKTPKIIEETSSSRSTYLIDHDNNSPWHLAKSDIEEKLSNFELLLWRLAYGFRKWQEDCQTCVSHDDVNADEIALMHLIRIRDRPKSLYEISKTMNRDDIPNLQYSLKKLIKLNIIQKAKKTVKKTTYFEITERGKRITERYGEIRRSILGDWLSDLEVHDWDVLMKTLNKFKEMYDEASRSAALYRDNRDLIE